MSTTPSQLRPTATLGAEALTATLAPATDARSRRMTMLLGAIVALSAVDLVATLHYMGSVGMYESNPLVRLLAESASPYVSISSFKALTVLIGGTLLYRLRHRATAQLAALVVLGVLVWLTVQWARYGVVMADVDPVLLARAARTDGFWVQLQ